jgi:hypothetical protein
MKTRRVGAGGAALFFLCVLSRPLGAQKAPASTEEVYLTPAQALALAFPGETYAEETVRLTPAQKTAAEKRLGWRLKNDPLTVYRAPSGYAVIADETGKFKPITFLVKAGSDFSVQRVDVMVYREERGGDVRTARFLRQFDGKTPESPLRPGRDVSNITGATLSVRALAAGVKRVLVVLEEVYGKK